MGSEISKLDSKHIPAASETPKFKKLLKKCLVV